MPNVSITLKAGHCGRPEVIDKIRNAGISILNDPGDFGMVFGTTDKTEDEIRISLKEIFAVSNVIYIEKYQLGESEKTGAFVGMTEADALATIKQKGWLYAIIGKDGHRVPLPEDWLDFTKPENESRVNLIIEDGKVIKSYHEHPFFEDRQRKSNG